MESMIISSVDSLWVLIAGILVMFMQPGFMLVETGFTRSKNSVNIVMKNFMDFSVGAITYWAFGFALAYGGSTLGGFLAYGDFFLEGQASTYFFQVVFAATTATIVSGAVAERTKFSAYLMFQPFICGVIYPIVTHWVWSGQGWLGDLGFIDFAGSGVVHMVGGFAALAGVMIVGPRIGKYDDKGSPLPLPGSSMVAGALGVFILWFGWYGFNVGSALAAVDVNLAAIAATTTLSAAAASITAMYTSMISGKPDVSMTLNGALAGLVGITAGADMLTPIQAVIVGLVTGAVAVVAVIQIDKAKVDDPVGAITVHLVCGIIGTLAVALNPDISFGVQLLGVISYGLVSFVFALILFSIIKATMGLRVTEEEETAGLDISEHGMESYS